MSKVIETLMSEHRVIQGVLGSFEAFVERLDEDGPNARERVAEFADFFREFADRCHHGKEEGHLFEALGEHRFPRDAGPLFVMVGEHNMGRSYVAVLSAIGAGVGTLRELERHEIRESAGAFIPLLRMHIQKEDEILFPAAERTLPPQVLEKLAGSFEEFERTVMGEGEHRRLHALGARLMAERPSAAAR